MRLLFASLVVVVVMSPSRAQQADRAIHLEKVVKATVDEVWKTWTTMGAWYA